jgi:hypothetical protein
MGIASHGIRKAVYGVTVSSCVGRHSKRQTITGMMGWLEAFDTLLYYPMRILHELLCFKIPEMVILPGLKGT